VVAPSQFPTMPPGKPSSSPSGGGGGGEVCPPDVLRRVANVNWFESAGCIARDPDLHVTVVSAQIDICHTVPPRVGGAANPYGGYR
jgi:hypothetical protein